MANAFAEQVLREDAHAVGTTQFMTIRRGTGTNEGGRIPLDAYFGTSTTPPATTYTDYRDFMRARGWVQFDAEGKRSDWTLR